MRFDFITKLVLSNNQVSNPILILSSESNQAKSNFILMQLKEIQK